MDSVKKEPSSQQFKSYEVMDVNPRCCSRSIRAMRDLLIHGHTTRANIMMCDGKKRIVIGNWKERLAQNFRRLMSNNHLQNLALKKWQSNLRFFNLYQIDITHNA